MKGSSIALIAFAGLGVGALYWFGFRKKSVSDLTAMFRGSPPVEPPPGVTYTPPPPREQGSRGITTPPPQMPPVPAEPNFGDVTTAFLGEGCKQLVISQGGSAENAGLCSYGAPLVVKAGDEFRKWIGL